jgi:Family of unknown function (DUF6159)
MRGGRFSRGWQLTKASWRALRADRSLLSFPVISGIGMLVVAAVLFTPAAVLSHGGERHLPLIVATVLVAYLGTFIAVFCNVALASCAARSLDGERTSVRHGLAASRARLGAIVVWSAIAATVGLALRALESAAQDNVLARIALSLVGVAWGVATFFVIPVLALEGVTGSAAFRRSAQLIRARWGESVAGSFSIGGIVVLLGVLPAIALIGLGVAAAGSAAAAGVALIAAGALVLLGALIVGSALSMVFRTALYRFATEGRATGGFEADELAGAFAPRRRRGRLAFG